MSRKFPISEEGLQSLVGKELYLMVQSEAETAELHRDLREIRQRAGYRLRVGIRNIAQRIGYGVRGKTPPKSLDPDSIDGLVCEVISRQPHLISNYLLGEAAIAFEDGQPVGATIDEKAVFEAYLFTPRDVEQSKGYTTFRGTASPYSLHEDKIGVPLEKNVRVTIATPAYKVRGDMACL